MSSIQQGTIGWSDADADHFDIGEGDSENLPLFRVTLAQGKLPGGDEREESQGHEVLCRWGMPILWVPPRGTQCLVAFPDGMQDTAAGGVIIAVMLKNGSQLKEDRALLAFGEDTHFLVKAKSVTTSDYGSPARYIMVGTSRGGGPAGVMVQDETGSGATVQAGVVGLFTASGGTAQSVIQMKPAEISLFVKDKAVVKIDADFFAGATKCTLQGAGVYLGKQPTPLMTALYGPMGMAGVPSTSVFLSV